MSSINNISNFIRTESIRSISRLYIYKIKMKKSRIIENDILNKNNNYSDYSMYSFVIRNGGIIAMHGYYIKGFSYRELFYDSLLNTNRLKVMTRW